MKKDNRGITLTEMIVTFDAHDPRVQNAVPLMGFDNVMPTYQVLKAILRDIEDIDLSKESFMIVSPDEGALNRNMYYASVLGVELGMFYKRRDYSTIVNGRNPIVAHEYLGNSVEGKDIFIADDIIYLVLNSHSPSHQLQDAEIVGIILAKLRQHNFLTLCD